jgi:hypothetical protein
MMSCTVTYVDYDNQVQVVVVEATTEEEGRRATPGCKEIISVEVDEE